MKVNWDVVKNVAIAVPTGLAVLTTLLNAAGLSTIQVGQITAVVLALAATLVWLIDTVKRAIDQTDQGKAASFERLDEAGKAAVLDNTALTTKQSIVQTLPDDVVLKAVNDMPEVTKIVTVEKPTNGVAKAVADPALPKVTTETQEKAA